MTRATLTLLVALSMAALVACEDGGDGLSTTQSALSTSDAFDACMAELEDCRLPDADVEECRQLEMECAPERAGEREEDWQAFCDGVDQRCEGDQISDELCGALQERCEAGEAGAAPQEPMDPEACYAGCMEDMDDAEACGERCGIEAL